jgi:hypothetical protein
MSDVSQSDRSREKRLCTPAAGAAPAAVDGRRRRAQTCAREHSVMSSPMPRSPPTPPVQLVSPNGSARRNRLLGLHEDARAGSGGEEQPLHAVDVVGIPGLDAELTAAADVLSRLDESPLCYFQWYVSLVVAA